MAAAVVALKESFIPINELNARRENKIKKLEIKLNEEKDEKKKIKIKNRIDKIKNKIERAQKTLQKYDDERKESEVIMWKRLSIVSILGMILGFLYLISVIIGMAFSYYRV